MGKPAKYVAKTLKGAEREVRALRRLVSMLRSDLESEYAIIQRQKRERLTLAKLAAETPQFFNPLDVIEAKKLRDDILHGRRL